MSFKILFLLSISAFSLPSEGKEEQKGCFNFKEKITLPIKAPPAKYEAGKDYSEKGKNKEEVDWAEVGGLVNKSVKDLYLKLLDPKTIRNGDNVKVVVTDLSSGPNGKFSLKYLEQAVELKPRWFLTLTWKESWAYTLQDGTAENPKSILIAYQKLEGTSHIEHFCGNILLQTISPTQSSVYIYQEMKASRRDAQNILDDISGTLRTLR